MRLAYVLLGGLHPSGTREVAPLWVGVLSALARRHDVHAFVLRHLPDATSYDLRGIQVHDLGRPSAPLALTRVAQWRALRRAVRAQGPFDVVHGVWADPAGLLAALVGRELGAPSVITCDSGEFVALPDIDYGEQRTWRRRRVVHTATMLASCVQVCTAHAASLASTVGVDTTLLPLGVAVPSEDDIPARADGPPWRLLQVASLNRVKGQELLIDALARLSRTHDVQLDIAGEDARGGAIQARAAALGLADRVRFHGWVEPDALAALRRTAHVYVQTSRHEGGGVSVLEAAGARLPIVGTRVGYVADWAPEAAVALDAPSPDELASALASCLDDRAGRDAVASAARAIAAARDVTWTVAALEQLYESLRRR